MCVISITLRGNNTVMGAKINGFINTQLRQMYSSIWMLFKLIVTYDNQNMLLNDTMVYIIYSYIIFLYNRIIVTL